MWNLLTSAHDVNIGTGTEITAAFEKGCKPKYFGFLKYFVARSEFLDQLDFDLESVDSNPPDLDDLDIDLEEINL
eukprot:scaffold241494_cov54-Attheya_sp.AAC.1